MPSLLKKMVEPEWRVKLDWVQYFKRFCEEHGGNPINYKGRLLFQDGWTYSATSHAGPEWAPPEDPKELVALVTVYWQEQLRALEVERRQLKAYVHGLTQLSQAKSVPLQATAIERGEDGKPLRKAVDVNLSALETRLNAVSLRIGGIENVLSELKSVVGATNEGSVA